MAGSIFLRQDESNLVELSEQEYDSEKLLQELIERFPNLLAGDQIDDDSPRRWLLIKREMGVPSEEGGGNKWSLDHLFLDQDAIPTLIEVKRSSDTRIRREVVGQMMDYAANAVVYWPLKDLRDHFESKGDDTETELQTFLGADADQEEFWDRVETNLRAGKIRMVFVADKIPPELLRIVEFLNEQMAPAEVLAIEIKQFVGQDGTQMLVPQLVGQTAAATIKKRSSARTEKWDKTSFFNSLASYQTSEEVRVAETLTEWLENNFSRVDWRIGKRGGQLLAVIQHNGVECSDIRVEANGYVRIRFRRLKAKEAFCNEAKRLELLRRLNVVDGVELPVDSINGGPKFPLSALNTEQSFSQFLDTLKWFQQEITSTS